MGERASEMRLRNVWAEGTVSGVWAWCSYTFTEKLSGHFIQTSEEEVALILDQLLASKAGRRHTICDLFMGRTVGSAGTYW